MLHFIFWISQLSEMELQVKIDVNEKSTFLKRAPHHKGVRNEAGISFKPTAQFRLSPFKYFKT